jgi:hypothetical protein
LLKEVNIKLFLIFNTRFESFKKFIKNVGFDKFILGATRSDLAFQTLQGIRLILTFPAILVS